MRVGGCPAAVAQWQSTGGSSQRCPGFDLFVSLVSRSNLECGVSKIGSGHSRARFITLTGLCEKYSFQVEASHDAATGHW